MAVIPFVGTPEEVVPPPPVSTILPPVSFVVSGESAPWAQRPVAHFVATPEYGVVGSVVRLDGRGSKDAEGLPLDYTWSFVSVPIGSRVRREGFRTLDADGSYVSFSPDVVGEYVVSLSVSNGTLESETVGLRGTPLSAPASISIRAMMVPHARGHVPDGKFLWSYLRDVWTQVEGKEFFETLWSALVQMVGAEMLKAYQVDFNKSIKSIQDLYQRRWLAYEPKLELEEEGLTLLLGQHAAGVDASSEPVGASGLLIVVGPDEVEVVLGGLMALDDIEYLEVTHSLSSTNTARYQVAGVTPRNQGYRLRKDGLPAAMDVGAEQVATGVVPSFDFQSDTWEVGSVSGLADGDVLRLTEGPNAGLYRVTARPDTTHVQVYPAPPAASAGEAASVYRPLPFRIRYPAGLALASVRIPLASGPGVPQLARGRVVLVNGQAYTLERTARDERQRVPCTFLSFVEKEVPAGLEALSWRTPHTLVSRTQDFESLGVSAGDTLVVDVVLEGEALSAEVALQVVGAAGKRLGFVLGTGPLVPGALPALAASARKALQEGLQLASADATLLEQLVSEGLFQRRYGNRELALDEVLEVGNQRFLLRPKHVIRNRRLPVDEDLRSVPALQEFIVQPQVVERDGGYYQEKDGTLYPLRAQPAFLVENLHYVLDAEVAFDGELHLVGGTDVIDVEDGDFLDRSVVPGDILEVVRPSHWAADYPIQAVLGPHALRLARPLPAGLGHEPEPAQVRIHRRSAGRFLRFAPGRFSAATPAPERLWAEVSFFDNWQSIEDNFGILVGLTKNDLERINSDLNYRQAVAGLMYAYTRGSALEKVRLGAQILLGLPFAEARGIIRSIEEDYRLDARGEPELGRILVEDVSPEGTPQGLMRVYTFPVDGASALSGLETNPETGQPYRVGDQVGLFAPLCKGVEVSDYLSSPPSGTLPSSRLLQQFHAIRMRANDSIFTLNEAQLVSDFLKKITPSYVSFFLSVLTEMDSPLDIRDWVRLGVSFPSGMLVSAAGFSVPVQPLFDARWGTQLPLNRWDDGLYWVRKTGTGLLTMQGDSVPVFLAGGLTEVGKAGDFLAIPDGPDAGLYEVQSLTATTFTLVSPPPQGFQTRNGGWALLRKAHWRLKSGQVALTSAVNTVALPNPERDNIAPGHWFCAGGRRFLITAVASTGLTLERNLGLTGTFDYQVVQPQFLPAQLGPYSVTGTGTQTVTLPAELQALLDIGDELESDLGLRYTVRDPVNGVLDLAFSGTHPVTLFKKNGGVGLDLNEKRGIRDALLLALRRPGASAGCTASSANVSFADDPVARGVLPGDLLKLTSGNNAVVDVGYGAGVYPIAEVSSGTVKLTKNLTATESAAYQFLRRR